MLKLIGRKLLKILKGVIEYLQWNCWLDIGGLSLNTLVANRRKLIPLIGHPASLPAHPQSTSFAGIVAVKRFSRIEQANAAHGFQGIKNFFGAASDDFDRVCREFARHKQSTIVEVIEETALSLCRCACVRNSACHKEAVKDC